LLEINGRIAFKEMPQEGGSNIEFSFVYVPLERGFSWTSLNRFQRGIKVNPRAVVNLGVANAGS